MVFKIVEREVYFFLQQWHRNTYVDKTFLRVFKLVVLSDGAFKPCHGGQISDSYGVDVSMVCFYCAQVSKQQMTVGTPLTLENKL